MGTHPSYNRVLRGAILTRKEYKILLRLNENIGLLLIKFFSRSYRCHLECIVHEEVITVTDSGGKEFKEE